MNKHIEFLKRIQKQMNYEEKFDNDIQANPRFWVIMDYRIVPANEDVDEGFTQYFYNNGDFIEIDTLEELREEIREMHEDVEIDGELLDLMDGGDFSELWEYLLEHLNEDGCYDTCYVREEPFIVQNTMFLTKKDAKNHLKLNSHHYTNKAHTYAMTAWRSNSVDNLLKAIKEIDWNKIDIKQDYT